MSIDSEAGIETRADHEPQRRACGSDALTLARQPEVAARWGTEMNNPLLLAVGPVVAAAITVGGIWLKEALQRRGGEEARRRRIDQAKAQIDIVEVWARARASLNGSTELAGSARTQAQEALDAAYDRAMQSAQEPRRHITLRLVSSRLLLRQYHMTGPIRLLRFLYYASFALPVFGAIGFLDPAQWSASGSVIGGNIVGYFIVCVLPLWILGWITSVLAGRRRGETDSPAGGATASATASATPWRRRGS